MRAWPAKFRGLRLQLSSGWYSIPAHVPAQERARLLELLAAGVADIDDVVELDWHGIDAAAAELQLERALVFVRVPETIEPDGEALRRVRAALGSVRLGVLQYEARGAWADVAWQERGIKPAVLLWIKRWLRDSAHPFAKLGVGELPVDELAGLTAEPVELLLGVEWVMDQRLRHRGQGMARADWRRSVLLFGAQRLGQRIWAIAEKLRGRALDFALANVERTQVSANNDREAALALAGVGLAWAEGNDLLLGPLVRLVGEPVVLRRLLELLPEGVWSEKGRREIAVVMEVLSPPPRAALIAPELPYASWSAIEPKFEIVGDVEDASAGLEALKNMFEELSQPALIALDFARGRIHRFDAVDRDVPVAEYRAYVRAVGLRFLLHHAHDRDRLDVLAEEVERTLELVDPSTPLAAAIRALQGDVLALRGRYRDALECWQPGEDARARYCCGVRRTFAHLRLDQVDAAIATDREVADVEAFTLFSKSHDEDFWARDMVTQLLRVSGEFDQPGTTPPNAPYLDVRPLKATRLAVAVELGDWPQAIHLANSLPPDPATPDGVRIELLRAWIQASLGDLDRAHASFDALRELTARRGDTLGEAFAQRGLAAIAWTREHPELALEALEAARDLERELELPDAELLELELLAWRVQLGQLPRADYDAKLAQLERSDPAAESPSFAHALRASQRRLDSAR